MFEQVRLDYKFDALEPHIDALTMETHYNKHHAAYTKNFNEAVTKAKLEGKSANEILLNLDKIEDPVLKKTLLNNGGGYCNHNLYFSTLSPNGGTPPTGKLSEKIESIFGDFESLKEKLSKTAMAQFGSGWAWLSKNANGELQVMASANQSNPRIETKGEWTEIFGVDIWEHAYYLKYKNMRADYISALWNVVDWNKISENYMK